MVASGALASRAASPSPLSPDGTRPPSRADRQLRFADVTTKDVHVYESAPPSPKRKPLALMSPTEADGPTISLGNFQDKGGKLVPSAEDTTQTSSPMAVDSPTLEKQPTINGDVVEGTPEDIRRRFFPNATPHDPSLAWMEDFLETAPSTSPTALRFDLAGKPISPADAEKLPTHLGLHHHAEGKHAGYTLDDIFLLSRSTVPAQRTSMLDVLSKITRQLSKTARQQGTSIRELAGQEGDLRKRILAAGLETMSERGTVGIRAVDLVWACVVFWDKDLNDIDGVELKTPSDDVLSPLPMEYVLVQIADAFNVATFPSETLFQLLEVLHRFAKHSNDIASSIVSTPKLLANVMRRFVLLPHVPEETNRPDPEALRFFDTLAQSSRQNATVVAESAEPLLRFVVALPSSSMYPEPLATTLLTTTFRFYTTLAGYGLCSQLATTAAEPLGKLRRYVLSESCKSDALREAWLLLLEAWMVCARDPHRTTPSHDILWSQIVSWSWGEDILKLRGLIAPSQNRLWTALWRAESAWLEGTTINAPKGGEAEKAMALAALQDDFAGGKVKQVVDGAVWELDAALSSFSPDDIPRTTSWRQLTEPVCVLSTVLRLWLSCLPSQTTPLVAPPFPLPFAEISTVCARLALHPLWMSVRNKAVPSHNLPFVRPLSLLLSAYLDFSRFLPGAQDDLWLAQAFAIILRLVPGDEERAIYLIERLASLTNPSFMETREWQVPPIIWERRGLEPILPFLTFSLEHAPVKVGPLWLTPASISTTTSLRVPAPVAEGPTRATTSLPLNRDWMFSPLDHLLRSGQSEVFSSLPSSWDFSETEMVRATVLLAKVHREILLLHGLQIFALSREETIFSCMKVFMLEHGQQQDTSAEEVFRDTVVGRLMEDLLAPFTFVAALSLPAPRPEGPSLEEVGTSFLGSGTPFYQYYTDFVGLYDSISFGHPLFSRLLLPPLAMRYPTDYRKCLWADFHQIVRTIKTPLEAVVSADIREYLWPIETDPEIISAYLRALAKGATQGPFVHLVAVHHVACNIWSDLGHVVVGEKAVRLLQAIVLQASPAVIKDVAAYHQTMEKLVLPPACFEGLDEAKESRRALVQLAGSAVRDRLGSLLD